MHSTHVSWKVGCIESPLSTKSRLGWLFSAMCTSHWYLKSVQRYLLGDKSLSSTEMGLSIFGAMNASLSLGFENHERTTGSWPIWYGFFYLWAPFPSQYKPSLTAIIKHYQPVEIPIFVQFVFWLLLAITHYELLLPINSNHQPMVNPQYQPLSMGDPHW